MAVARLGALSGRTSTVVISVSATVVLVAGIFALAVGFASRHRAAPTHTAAVTDPPGTQSLPTYERSTDGIGQASGLLTATVVIDTSSGCVWVRDMSGGLHGVVWPRGYSLQLAGPTPHVSDETGSVVINSGQRLTAGSSTWTGSYPRRCGSSEDTYQVWDPKPLAG